MTAELIILSLGFVLAAASAVALVRAHDWVCLTTEVAFFLVWSQWLVTPAPTAWGYGVAAVMAIEALVMSRRGRRVQPWVMLAAATAVFCSTLAGLA